LVWREARVSGLATQAERSQERSQNKWTKVRRGLPLDLAQTERQVERFANQHDCYDKNNNNNNDGATNNVDNNAPA